MKTVNISISFDCVGAGKLREKNIRNEAYPFDWNVKNIRSILNIINDNFIDLFNEEYLVFSNKSYNHKYDNNANDYRNLIPAYNKKYDIFFIHDFTLDNNKKEIIDKYNRRINRFNETMSDKNNKINLYYSKYNLIYKHKIYDYWINYFEDDCKQIILNNKNNIKNDININIFKTELIKKYNNSNINVIFI